MFALWSGLEPQYDSLFRTQKILFHTTLIIGFVPYFRAVAGRVGEKDSEERMSPSLQAYLTENNTVSVYANDMMVSDNVTIFDKAAVAILSGKLERGLVLAQIFCRKKHNQR